MRARVAALAFALALPLAFCGAGMASSAEPLDPKPEHPLQRLAPPPAGKLYHGVYPGGKSGEEDDIAEADLAAYQNAAGQSAAWVYFSNNWFRSREFPLVTAQWIRKTGAIPFIRLMLRSSSKENKREPLFTLDALIAGKFDADIKKWGAQAKAFASPLLAEYGTECNGEWFPWNGKWNGADDTKGFGDPEKADGPERFVAAYRHIVDIVRGEGARNVVWVFHVNADDAPDDKWNRFANYYPGDDYADWLAVSVYGPKTPEDNEAEDFAPQMDKAYKRLHKMAPDKPVIVAEFGCAAGHRKVSADKWAAEALDGVLAHKWPNVAGFSWWNERWENGRRAADTTMRLQDSKALAKVFREKLAEAKDKLQTQPIAAPAETEQKRKP
ncbi:MAG: beta-mannanase [Planctomycetes bacterium]|nr:beta-mannanase [Planctomycetota bacterium]